MAKLIILNENIDDIMKTFKSLEESVLLIKYINEKMKQKNKKVHFLAYYEVPLGASLLGNLLTGKRLKANIPGWEVKKAGEGMIRTGQNFLCCLIL